MENTFQKRVLCSVILSSALSVPFAVYSAQPVHLNHQPFKQLNSFVALPGEMKEVSREVDFNKTEHVRLQQTYQGYQVLGGDAILHKRREATTMNGLVYKNLEADLVGKPEIIFNKSQSEKAFSSVIKLAPAQGFLPSSAQKRSDLKVFVDKNNLAHWVYVVSYTTTTKKGMPAIPTYIVDAETMEVYQQWDNVMTLDRVKAGGYGGNRKMGMYSYDDGDSERPAYVVSRDAANQTCYLKDDEVVIRDARHDWDEVSFSCAKPVSGHHNLYWNGGTMANPQVEEMLNPDAANGAYSPSADAYYAVHQIKNMYRDWFHVNPAINIFTHEPMKITVFTHSGPIANAAWMLDHMVIYDGDDTLYPLASIGVIAHEVSHQFTLVHSLLQYYSQSGGLNESFSDMAAKAVEYYADPQKPIVWSIGEEVFKAEGKALRYMDHPSKDCSEDSPMCSIENVKDMSPWLDVHYLSGIYNRVFYLMSTAPGWDVKKAFSVMVQANMYYWTAMTSFQDAGCGVISAAKDYQYDTETVANALNDVGLDAGKCER